MKITICGSQGVGKTTLVDNLPEKYQKYVIKKVIRNIVEKSDKRIKVNEKADMCSQTSFFEAYLNILSDKKDYITDRGLLDVCAYTSYLMYKRKLGSGLYMIQRRCVEEYIQKNPDAVFIYIPIEFELEVDGFRSLDKTYQDECDRSIRMVFDDLGINPIVICGPQEKRDKEFLKVIETIEKGKKPKSPNPLKPYKKLELVPPQKTVKTPVETEEADDETETFEITPEEAKKAFK